MKKRRNGSAKGLDLRYVFTGGALGWALIFLTTTVLGQTRNEASAQQAAKSWLALVDAGRYGESWNQVAQYLKKKITKDQWVTELNQIRTPLGTVKSRRLDSTQFKDNLPGLPAGQYAAVRYTTAFANAPPGTELVALMLENGQWRVVAYFPQARFGEHSK
jgi:hypothetical protein